MTSLGIVSVSYSLAFKYSNWIHWLDNLTALQTECETYFHKNGGAMSYAAREKAARVVLLLVGGGEKSTPANHAESLETNKREIKNKKAKIRPWPAVVHVSQWPFSGVWGKVGVQCRAAAAVFCSPLSPGSLQKKLQQLTNFIACATNCRGCVHDLH